jgi:two-component system sensor histidine kinase CpxA
MLRLRFSLFTRILLWFFLNLIVLGIVLLVFFNLHFRLGPDSLLLAESGNRIEAIARQIASEMRDASAEEREIILKRYSETWQVDFLLYAGNGEQLAGTNTPLPTEVRQQMMEPGPFREPPFGRPPRGNPPPRRRPPPIFNLKTSNPTRYWAVVRFPIPLFEREPAPPRRAVLIVSSDSMSGNGLFFDPSPWIIVVAVVFLLSILLWLPFVRGLTRSIKQMTAATEQIAEEHFDVRVDDHRTDEIGRLGKAVNHLAARLSGFVGGQKRFLGDISHELNSPLARMQFALSILEERVDTAHRGYVEDAQEEVRLMSNLVSELLAYARAGMKTSEIKLERVPLRRLVQQVTSREASAHDVRIEIDKTVEVMAQPELLSRALANVIRNAVRYAAAAGPITVEASLKGDQVKISVADCGPGVAEEALGKLFDPFFRLEPDRARSSGGAGLGLAIVKTCIDACQGTVTAHNRTPSGLEVIITLRAAQ